MRRRARQQQPVADALRERRKRTIAGHLELPAEGELPECIGIHELTEHAEILQDARACRGEASAAIEPEVGVHALAECFELVGTIRRVARRKDAGTAQRVTQRAADERVGYACRIQRDALDTPDRETDGRDQEEQGECHGEPHAERACGECATDRDGWGAVRSSRP